MTHTKDEALKLEALILKTGMNPVMQGICYVMHPEAMQAVIDEAIKQSLAAPVQEPFGYLEIDDIESQREYPNNCRNVNLWHEGGEGMVAIYTTPPAAQPAHISPKQLLALAQEANLGLDKVIEVFRIAAQPAPVPPAQPAIPDAIHHTDLSEHPEYIQGWNDCRQAMMEMMK
jgi:hypothetical protein